MLILFAIASAFAITDWIAVSTSNKKLEYLAKPATLFFLIAWYASLLPKPFPGIGIWFGLGLLFSLAGDIFLMLPGDHFLKGLVSFLIAHIAYIIAFNLHGAVFGSTSMLLAIGIILIAGVIMRRIILALKTKGRTSMIIPLIAYAVVLCLTFWSAATTLLRASWPALAGWSSIVGGALFFMSDAAIAWNRFVGPHPGGRLMEMITYHLAQVCLSCGILIALGASLF
jgi:uncharacterized membrane protein YhhN